MTDTNPLHVPPANPGGDGLDRDDAAESAQRAHDILIERAATCGDYANMTRISGDMSREEVIAKVMGIPLEEVPNVLAKLEKPPG